MDSEASFHITSDLQNLSLHNSYGGNDDIIIGDGKQLPITHNGSTILNLHTLNFILDNVLYTPHIKQNLISISQLCK
ncbi:hypothetical protein BHM03_00007073 [Ensete ventricosum]|nr:hypothetical protein BHM03_00007073 [Ensete ventricosum]